MSDQYSQATSMLFYLRTVSLGMVSGHGMHLPGVCDMYSLLFTPMLGSQWGPCSCIANITGMCVHVLDSAIPQPLLVGVSYKTQRGVFCHCVVAVGTATG
jgi:hypothetical protein